MTILTMLKTSVTAVVVTALAGSALWAHAGETYVVCKSNALGFAPLRSCDSPKCEALMQMPRGTAMQATGPYSGTPWREVTVLNGAYMLPIGPDGWVNSKYLCEIAD